jgi:hypothetical protein
MARGKKTGGRDFTKGQVTNPKGRPKIPDDVKQARKLTTLQLITTFNKLIYMTDTDLKAHYQDSKTPVFERIVCKVLHLAEMKGDHYRLDFVLDRLIGKVTDKVEVKVPTPTVITRLNGTIVELGAKLEDDSEDESND